MNYCFYNKKTGYFVDYKYSSSKIDHLDINTPEGCIAIEGDFDHLSQRVDIVSGAVIDYQPPQPSDEHEWNSEAGRWLIKPEVERKRLVKSQTLDQLQKLDARHLRALDEVVASPDNAVARDNLDSIRKLKEQLRKKLV